MQRIVMLGPSGAGKGTQSERLSKTFGLPHISTGEMLNDAMRQGTPLGRQIYDRMEAGLFPTDDEVNQVLIARLKAADCQSGWILDGYPRRLSQAEGLDQLQPPELAVLLDISDDQALRRMAGRRVCLKGHTYHLQSMRPKRPGICDVDGLRLQSRKEDGPTARLQRLLSYRCETLPVVDYYQRRHLLLRIDGVQAVDLISKYLLTLLQLKNR